MVGGTSLMGALQGNSILTLIFYVIVIIGQWKVFEKAGEEGWKSLIPIYNAYILWKIAGRSFIKPILAIVGWVVLSIIMTGLAFSNSGGFLSFVMFVLYIALIIYIIVEVARLCNGLSKAFGHGTGFAVGLFFLNPIFIIILGFNSDEYQGTTNN